MFLTEIYKVGKGLAVNNWIFWLLIIFGWWMEDPPSLEPIQRLISSWLCLELDAQIFWEPCWLNPGHAVVFARYLVTNVTNTP